jgi:hypothetical protein
MSTTPRGLIVDDEPDVACANHPFPGVPGRDASRGALVR